MLGNSEVREWNEDRCEEKYLRNLKYSLAHAKKAYNDTTSVYEAILSVSEALFLLFIYYLIWISTKQKESRSDIEVIWFLICWSANW